MKTWLSESGEYLDIVNIVAGVGTLWNAVIVGASIALIATAATTGSTKSRNGPIWQSASGPLSRRG